jgi:hypothetical protein
MLGRFISGHLGPSESYIWSGGLKEAGFFDHGII